MTPSRTTGKSRFVALDRLHEQLGRPMRVAILARRSRDDPDTKSLQVQVAAAEDYLRGLPEGSWKCDLRDVVDGGDVFRQVVSGWKGNGQHKLLNAVLGELARYDVVIVFRLDRLARRLTASVNALEKMEQAGVRLYSTQERLDSADPASWFSLRLHMMLAEQSSSDTSARIVASKDHARSVGGWRGGSVLYGYRVATVALADGTEVAVRDAHRYKRLELDPVKAEILRWAAAEVVDRGSSISALVRTLNSRGVPGPRSGTVTTDGTVRTTEWCVTTLMQILRNPALQGFDMVASPQAELTATPGAGGSDPAGSAATRKAYEVLLVDGKPHRPNPPILSDERWAQVHAALTGATVVHQGRGEALLRGLVRCEGTREDGDRCGRPLYGPSDPTGSTASYACRARSLHPAGDPRRCSGNAISARWLETMVVTTARIIVDTPAWRAALQDAHTTVAVALTVDHGSSAAGIAALKTQMDELRAEYKQSQSTHAKTLVRADLDELDQRMAELERERSTRVPSTLRAAPLLPGSFDELWEGLERSEQRALLGDLIERIEVTSYDTGASAGGRRFDATRVRIELRHVGTLHLTDSSDLTAVPCSCPECGVEYGDARALGMHRRQKHGVRGAGAAARPAPPHYLCPDQGCDRTSHSAGGIARHHRTAHGAAEHHPCAFSGCGRVLGGTNELATHIRCAHTPPGATPLDPTRADNLTAECDLCGRVLLNDAGLRIHRGRVHNPTSA